MIGGRWRRSKRVCSPDLRAVPPRICLAEVRYAASIGHSLHLSRSAACDPKRKAVGNHGGGVFHILLTERRNTRHPVHSLSSSVGAVTVT
jgi:hypothetical protein